MKTVIFIILPFSSHYYVAFGTAHYLKKNGYRVIFTCKENQMKLVEDEGFEFQKLLYFSEFKKLNLRTLVSLFLKTILDKSFVKNRYREFYDCVLELKSLYKNFNPDLIFIDHHLGEYAIFSQNYNSKITILNTKLSCYQSIGIPPLGVGWVSKNRFFDKIRAEFNWFRLRLRHKQKSVLEWLAFAGKNDKAFFKRWAKKHGVVWDDFFEENSSTYNIVKYVPKLIIYPKCIEYPFKKLFKDEFYIEIPFQKNENSYFSESYNEVIELIKSKKKQDKNIKVVYCAFGTISGNVRKRADLLLTKVVDAINDLPNVILILVNNTMAESRIMANENVFIFEKVPQLHILKYTDLMITHGGLNSISECIQANVPMLTFPLIKKVDHFGNSARVVANGFGLKGDIETDTVNVIRAKIQNLLSKKCFKNELQKRHTLNETNIDSFINGLFLKNK